jgi:hypothetical protein
MGAPFNVETVDGDRQYALAQQIRPASHRFDARRRANAVHIAAFDRDTCLALVEIAMAASAVSDHWDGYGDDLDCDPDCEEGDGEDPAGRKLLRVLRTALAKVTA